MSDRHEARLLLAILAGRWDDAQTLVAGRPPDASRFLALCRACDIHPQVHDRLTAAGRQALAGREVMERLDALRHKTRMDNLILLARLASLIDRLSAEKIVPVALKGVAVLPRFYEFDGRTLDDIDLLVRPRDRDRTLAAVERAGWTGPSGAARHHWLHSSYEMPFASPGPVTVSCEIHWSLGQDVRYCIDADAVIDRAQGCEVEGRPLLRLDDHDAVAHLLLHHVQHYFDRRLKWVLELGMLSRAPGFSWPVVAARLDQWGGRAAAGLALAHVRRLFPDLLDGAAYAALPAALWRRAATVPLRATHPLDYFRGTRARSIQLLIAAAALERPSQLPRYLRHRAGRDRESDTMAAFGEERR